MDPAGKTPGGRAAGTDLFATTARGTEELLAAELAGLGASAVKAERAGVAFRGSLETAYRACLWSRVASRILLPLASFPAETPQALYDRVRSMRWDDHIGPRNTLAVDFVTSESGIRHSHFGALKAKDAIVDQIRDRTGMRPSIDVRRPDVRVNVHLHRNQATVSIDLSGESLHRRGYRRAGGPAPLKENLAAAILLLAGWPHLARLRVPFVDPMCGSATLPIEAALIATDTAPGALRSHFGFLAWRGHHPGLWRALRQEARERARSSRGQPPPIVGYDEDGRAVTAALANLDRAGLRGIVHVEKRPLARCEAPAASGAGIRGLLATNPPYGERLGDETTLHAVYAGLGDLLRHRFLGWNTFVLTGNPRLAKAIGLRPARRHVLFNGAIECRLLEIPISHMPASRGGRPRWRQEAHLPPSVFARG